MRIGLLSLFLWVSVFSFAEPYEISLSRPGTLKGQNIGGSNVKIFGELYACDLSYLASQLRQKTYFETLTTIDLSDVKIILSDNSKQNSYTYLQDGQECTDVMSSADVIPESMFESCTSLIRMVLPASLKQIGNRAFYGSSLLTIDVPQSVERVGRQAFQGCRHLQRVYLYGSPMIGRDAFKDTPKLSDVYVEPAVPFTIDANAFDRYDFTLHAHVYNSDQDGAPWNKIKENVSMVGKLASTAPVTYHLDEPGTLSDWSRWPSELDVGTISDLKVTGKLYPSDIFWLKSHMFGRNENSALRRLDLSEAELVMADNVENNTYTNGFGETVAVRSESDFADIFQDCGGLDFLGLPNGITDIPSQCFASSSTAIEMSIPKTVRSIGYEAFSNDETLAVLDIKEGAITSLGITAFWNCTSLMSISLPNSITQIGDRCFYGCSSLRKALVPFGVDNLEMGIFEDCASLEFVRIGHSSKPTTVGVVAFSGCTSLKTVLMTNTITSFGRLCFNGCTSLEVLNIPESVTEIGERCFDDCTNLKTVYVAPKEIYASKFADWHFKDVLSADLLRPFVSSFIGYNALCSRTVCFRNKVILAKAPYYDKGYFKVYSVAGIQDNKVILSEVTNGVLEPGTSYIFGGGNNAYFSDGSMMYGITFTLEDGEGPLVENALLQGVYEDTHAPVGSYVLQPDGRFHLVAQANTIKVGANHAYLNIPGANNAPSLAVQFGGATTAVRGITETVKEPSSNLYDLMGRRVTTPQKGQIYIRGGKKVIY